MRHFPENQKHREFPDEHGKLDAKTKLLLNTTREVVLAILDGKDSAQLKKYKKNIDWAHVPKKLGKQKNFMFEVSHHYVPPKSHETQIVKTKTIIHQALKEVGINKDNTENRIRTAINSLESQYEYMSKERFQHRMKNGKVLRDARFLLGVPYLLGSAGKEARNSTLQKLSSKRTYTSLMDPNHATANKALKTLLNTLKKHVKKDKTGKSQYKKFVRQLGQYIDEFSEKKLTSQESSVLSIKSDGAANTRDARRRNV